MDHVTLSFETPGQLEPVPHGWYFGRSDTSEVLTNVKINGLNEWDVHKLGWLKHDGELQFHHAEVKPAFSAETLNCKVCISNSIPIDCVCTSRFCYW